MRPLYLVLASLIISLLHPAIVLAQAVGCFDSAFSIPRRVGVVNAIHDHWFESNLTAANDLSSLGIRAIKIWPRENYLSPDMITIYQNPNFDVIVLRPLQNSVLETSCAGQLYWRWENIDYGSVAANLYATVGHLPKVIILTGWEQDWQIKGLSCNRVPTATEQNSYLALLNDRQNGVAAARAANSGKALKVYHAVEVNHVLSSSFRVIDSLIPLMDQDPDFISYSHWSTTFTVTETLARIQLASGICPNRLILGEIGRTEPPDPYGYLYSNISEAYDFGARLSFLWSYRDQFGCPKTSGRWLRRCDGSLATSFNPLVDLKAVYE